MCDINYELLKDHLKEAANSVQECQINDFNIDIEIFDSINILANSKMIGEKHYVISISKAVFEQVKNLVDFYSAIVTKEALDNYDFSYDRTFYCFPIDGSEKNVFCNTVATAVIDNILCHELGHVFLGHCDDLVDHCMYENQTEDRKGYDWQAKELHADAFGIHKALSVALYSSSIIRSSDDMRDYKHFKLVKSIHFIELLSLYIQNVVFAANDDLCEYGKKIEFEKRSHPHPYVRVVAGFEFAREAYIQLLSEHFHEDVDEAEGHIDLFYKTNVNNVDCFYDKLPKYGEIVKNENVVINYLQILSDDYFNSYKSKYIDFDLDEFVMLESFSKYYELEKEKGEELYKNSHFAELLFKNSEIIE